MPEIPQLNQTTGLEYTSPVQIASVEQAGISGQQIQRFGSAVAELGQDIGDIQNRKKAAQRNLDAATDHQDSLSAALQVRDEIVRDPNINPNSYSKEFTSRYERAIAPIRKRREGGDALVSQASSNELSEVKNKFVADLNHLGLVEGAAQVQKQIGNLSSKASAISYLDASQIDGQILVFDRAVDALEKTQYYDAKTALKVRAEGPSEIVRGGIIGEVSRNQYDNAGNLLRKYAPYLDVQKVQDLQNYIISKKSEYTNEQLKEIDRKDKYNKKVLTETQDLNFSSMAQLILAAPDDETKQKLFAQSREMVAKKQLQADGDGSYNTLLKLDKDAKGEADAVWMYNFTERLTGDVNLVALRKSVISDVSGNKAGHSDGIKALKAIATYQDRVESDPIYKAKFMAAKIRVSEQFGKENPFIPSLFPKASRDARDQLMRRWLDVIDRNRNMDPGVAAEIVIKGHFGKIPVSVPGMSIAEQQSQSGIDKGLEKLKNKLKNKEIDKKQYLESLKKAQQQKDYLQYQGVKK